MHSYSALAAFSILSNVQPHVLVQCSWSVRGIFSVSFISLRCGVLYRWCCTWCFSYLNETSQAKCTKFKCDEEITALIACCRFVCKTKTKTRKEHRQEGERNIHFNHGTQYMYFWHFQCTVHMHTVCTCNTCIFGASNFPNNIEMNLKWLLVVTATLDCWLLYQKH